MRSKRLLAMLLTLTMVVSGVPSAAIAAETEAPEQVEEQQYNDVEAQDSVEDGEAADITEVPAETQEEETVPAETASEEEVPAEAEASETEEAPAQAEEAEAMTFEGRANGVNVYVEAPAGAFEAGTVMTVKKASAQDVIDAINDTEDVNIEVKSVKAVDITFTDANGEAQPKLPINVKLTSDLVAETEAPIVVHVDDDGVAEEMTEVQAVEGEDDAIEFEAEHFSVYAIVETDKIITYRYTYHFLNEIDENGNATEYKFINKAGEMVSTQIVKNGETLETVSGPASSIEKPFSAWYIATKNADGTYTITNEQLSFEQPISVSEDKDIYVAPFYGASIIATFYDKVEGSDNINIVTKRVVPLIGGQATVQVNNISVPTTATTVLTGWTVDGTDYALSSNPTIVTTKNIDLYPVFTEGHWIRFVGGEAGSGAEYVPAVFVTANTNVETLEKLTPSRRDGFDFDGWYYGSMDSSSGVITYGERVSDRDGNVTSQAASALLDAAQDEDITLYGKWTGKTVKYRVVVWYENADDSNYTFQEIIEQQGSTGDWTNVAASAVNGFTAKQIEQQIIKGDGSTIINVYYDRNVYSLNFYDTRNRLISDLTVTAKYGEDIHAEWPGSKAGTESYGALWYINSNKRKTISGLTTMPLNGHSYYQCSTGRYAYDDLYLIQSVNGGNDFSVYLHHPYTSNEAWQLGPEDFTPIKGFRINANSASDAEEIRDAAEEVGSDKDAVCEPSYNRSPAIGTSVSSGSWETYQGNRYRTLRYYYLRNKYKVTFDDNFGNTVEELQDIYYDANIAQVKATEIADINNRYAVGETIKTVTGFGDYVFKGWYDNASCLGDPYNFNQNMPAGNITLYAKWEPIEYLVQIDPNGGEITADGEVTYTWLKYGDVLHRYNIYRNYVEDTNGTYQYFNVKYPGNDNDTIISTQRKAGYVTDTSTLTEGQQIWVDSSNKYKKATSDDYYSLVGWYDTYTNKVYDFSSPITGPTSIQARWRRSGTFDIWYNPVNSIGGVLVSGTISNEQDAGYADKAETTIINTPSDIIGDDGKSYVFKGWQLVNNFIDNSPLDETLYLQGDDFLVNAEQSTEHKLFLLAIYESADTSEVPVSVTNLVFDPNGAEGEQKSYEGLQLNASFDLSDANNFYSRTSYKLVGWSQNKNAKAGDADVFATDTVIGVDNLDPMETVIEDDGTEVRKNILYAIWDSTFYVFHSSDQTVQTFTAEDFKDDNTFDITGAVKSGYIYGGYYKDYPGKGSYKGDGIATKDGANYSGAPGIWIAGDAYTSAVTATGGGIGTAMTPVAGQTYYLKEVPDAYMQASNYEIYHKTTRVEKAFYFVTAVDDNNYQEVGFKIGARNTDYKSTLTEKISLTYTDPDPEIYDSWDSGELDVSSFNFNNVEAGYVAYVQNDKIITTAGASVTYRPYFKTFDGVFVYGRRQHTAKSNRKVNPVTFDSVTITKKMFW